MRRSLFALAVSLASLPFSDARADLSPEDLAKIAQNPVGNLVSVPIQENANLHVGPLEDRQSVLNVQPVIPISISSDWLSMPAGRRAG